MPRLVAVFVLSMCFAVLPTSTAHAQRPIYVIAHRINDVDQIDKALSLGANAIECDIHFRRTEGQLELVVDHDGVTPRSTKLQDWLAAAKKAADKHPHFALVYFDMKVKEVDAAAPAELRKQARAVLPDDVALIFSTARFENRAHFDTIKTELGPKDGLAIDWDQDAAAIEKYVRDELGTKKFWYGYGTPVGRPGRLEDTIRAGVQVRDGSGEFKKVCVWTLESNATIEKYLKDTAVDAMIVEPKHTVPFRASPVTVAVKLAQQYGRLATRSDDPFVVYQK